MEDTLAVDMSAVKEPFTGTDNCRESVAEIAGFARENHPSARIAKGKMEQARYELKTARWQFLPSLSLSGGWSTSYYTYPGRTDYTAVPFASQFRNNGGEYVQLSLSFPLYDRLSRFSSLSKRRTVCGVCRPNMNRPYTILSQEVTRAAQDSQGALAAFFQAEKRSMVQEEAYRLNEKKLMQGLISPIEFRTVLNDYLNAQAELLNARFSIC